jgi:uncharacterized protein (DUF433 family)
MSCGYGDEYMSLLRKRRMWRKSHDTLRRGADEVYPHHRHPHQMGGLPCIRSLRIPVATVVGMLAEGMAAEEVLQALPDLELADITEALQYGVKNHVE